MQAIGDGGGTQRAVGRGFPCPGMDGSLQTPVTQATPAQAFALTALQSQGQVTLLKASCSADPGLAGERRCGRDEMGGFLSLPGSPLLLQTRAPVGLTAL